MILNRQLNLTTSRFGVMSWLTSLCAFFILQPPHLSRYLIIRCLILPATSTASQRLGDPAEAESTGTLSILLSYTCQLAVYLPAGLARREAAHFPAAYSAIAARSPHTSSPFAHSVGPHWSELARGSGSARSVQRDACRQHQPPS